MNPTPEWAAHFTKPGPMETRRLRWIPDPKSEEAGLALRVQKLGRGTNVRS